MSKTFHALRSGSPTSDNPVKLPRRVRKSCVEMWSWVSPDQSLLDTQAHRSTHRPALQGLLVVSCLCGLPQQLMVSRTAAHGKPQQLGETEAQRRQRGLGSHSWPCLSPSFPCIQLSWPGVAAYPSGSTRDSLANSCSGLGSPEEVQLAGSCLWSFPAQCYVLLSSLLYMCGAGCGTQDLGQARQSLYL